MILRLIVKLSLVLVVRVIHPKICREIYVSNFIFNILYCRASLNNIPPPIQHFFSNVYLFCLHKDLNVASKLQPIGIPTAKRRIIARYVAQTFKSKFAEYLLPYNYAVGIPNGGVTIILTLTRMKCEGSSQGCPLSPILAAIVVVRLRKPIDQSLCQRALQRLEAGILHDDNYGGRTHHPPSRRPPFLIPTISTTWNPPWLLHKPWENKNTNHLFKLFRSP